MTLTHEMASFFDDFVAAFSRFDGAHIAERYVAPYVALQTDGGIQCFTEHTEIGRFFQRIVAEYHEKGCRSCRYKDVEASPLGNQSALATVTWELLLEDESLLSAWRESYNLVRTDNGWRIFASVDHVS